MTDNLKNFLEFLGNNQELAEKLKLINTDDLDKTKETVIALAKENGFELTAADFEAPDGELSEDELHTISGGGECYCVVGGGGTEDAYGNICVCVISGTGFSHYSDTQDRCYCAVGGYGRASQYFEAPENEMSDEELNIVSGGGICPISGGGSGTHIIIQLS